MTDGGMMSLIQQRHSIDRVRVRALVALVCGVALLGLGVVLLGFAEQPSRGLFQVIPGVAALGYSAANFFRHRKLIRAFEDEHGTDAGRQDPIR